MSCYAAKAPRVVFIALMFAVALMIGDTCALAQELQPQTRKTPTPFGEMKIAPANLTFKEITFRKTAASESASFSVEDIGTAPLTVTIGNTGSPDFAVTRGAGLSMLAAKGTPLMVTVLFGPRADGTFHDSLSIVSNATKGKAIVAMALKGVAKGTPPPAPTATPTPTAIPTPSASATRTATATATATSNATISATPIATLAATATASPTNTGTATATATATPSATATATPTSTATVTITAPRGGATVSGAVPILVSAAGTVAFVNVYIDGAYLASTPPSTISWSSTTVSNGSHLISANAYAANSAILANASVSVIVQNSAQPTATETATPSASPTPSGAFFTGSIAADGTPISGATITFYAVGDSGYGSNATSLGTATTASDGTYNVSYTCSSGTAETYVVASGGTTAIGTNSAIGLIAPIGPCGSIDTSTNVVINELTTAAAEVALAQFIDSTGQMVGASSTNNSGLALGYLNYYNLAEVASDADFSVSGTASGFLPSSDQCFSQAQAPPPNCDGLERLNTLANVIAACVSSAGPDSSPCDALLTATSTSPSGTTLAALHAIATSPALNVDRVFAVQSMITVLPYAPALGVAPEGFEIGLMLNVGDDLSSANRALAIDSEGDLLVVSFDAVTSTGAVSELIASSGYSALANFAPGISVADTPSLAIDTSDDLFITSRDSNAVSELTSASSYLNGILLNTGGEAAFDHPQSIALDANGNMFVANNPSGSSGTVSELAALGDYSTGFNFASADANLSCPNSLVLDFSSNIFVANCDNTVSELTEGTNYTSGSSFALAAPDDQNAATAQSSIALDANSNVFVLTTGAMIGGVSELTQASEHRAGEFFSPPGAALDEPAAMALDSAGDVFAANANLGIGISELTTASQYATGVIFVPAGANLCQPDGIAIDAAGNIFVANACSAFQGTAPAVSELIGLGAPVLTPVEACLQQGQNICLP